MLGDPLTPAELQRIFDEDIRPYYFPDNLAPDAEPTIVLVGGQPGAGKSQATSRIARDYPGIVPLSGDNLRAFHPDYAQLVRDRPFDAGPILAQATAVWVKNAIDYAREHRHSLQLEGTFHTPSLTLATARNFRDTGFRTEIVALATARRDSLIAAAGRYFTDHQAGGEPRWTTLEQHDRGWNGTRDLLAQITPEAPLNRVKIVTRSGELYDAPIQDYDQDTALEALTKGRTVAATNRGAAAWLAELRAFTQYAQASNQITPATAPLLTEMHRIALSEVVPSMQLPANSEAAPRLVERLNDTMTMIERTAAPKRVDDYQAPGTSLHPEGPGLS
ncbi:zeta toxin family protein [Microbacterium maritypicum]|uniref:zeta toxin family protein n=1 Tax=Microbacterium TaxID=33882 RepID=UPI001F599452|nr:zeta toxin family protein [Microbacterium lacticum]